MDAARTQVAVAGSRKRVLVFIMASMILIMALTSTGMLIYGKVSSI